LAEKIIAKNVCYFFYRDIAFIGKGKTGNLEVVSLTMDINYLSEKLYWWYLFTVLCLFAGCNSALGITFVEHLNSVYPAVNAMVVQTYP